MLKSWRLLALAAAIHLAAGAGAASAQTVMVRDAPPGTPVEVVLNDAVVGSAPAGPSGDVSIPLTMPWTATKTETDVYLFVDVCGEMRRVVIVERTAAAMPPGSCERREIPGLFLLRRISTVVVNVTGPTPTVLLRQGKFRVGPARIWKPAPTGFVLFGAGALTTTRDVGFMFCGTVEGCNPDDGGFGYTVGATYWLTRFLGAEVSYVKPAEFTGSLSGDNLSFDSALDVDIVTVGGTLGIPIRAGRIYGHGGGNYQTAAATTVQRIGTASQTIRFKTEGWSWGFGGGAELWLTSRFAVYAEGNTLKLKGTSDDDSEAVLNDRLTTVFVGARVRIGG